MPNKANKPWKTLSSEEIYKNPWIRVRKDQVLNHKGTPLTYGIVELNTPSVYIVATNKDGKVFMVCSYRYTIDQTCWETPAGHSDGEDLLHAAKRELKEETGLVGKEWVYLGKLYQATGIGNIPLAVYWAKDVYKTSNGAEEQEQITDQKFFDLAEIEAMARNGEINESAVLGVIYLAKLHGL